MTSVSSSSVNTAEATTSTGVETPATTLSSVDSDVAPLTLDVKFVDSRWDEESDSWKYNDTVNPDTPAELVQPMGAEATDSNSWEEYCFVVVRKLSKNSENSRRTITFEIVLKSPYLIQACRNVMDGIRGVSWNSQPITLDPKTLIAYFPRLEEYAQRLKSRTDRTEEDDRVLKTLEVLLAHMRQHYKQTLARIASLIENHEITFDLLYAILLPGTVIIRRCPVTRETRALKLLAANRYTTNCGQYWSLECEYLEFGTNEDDGAEQDIGWGDNAEQPARFGLLDGSAQIRGFEGVEKINSLNAYPIEFHPDPAALKAMLLERARKWVSLCGVHHMHYKGNAGRYEWIAGNHKLRRYSVRSRIMVDKASFSRIEADYDLPNPERMLPPRADDNGVYGLTDAELLLAPPIVYGFSLADKLWLEFNVNHVAPIVWNDETFAGLVLPPERKVLLRGLIEAHGRLSSEGPTRFDDFVRGKGQGLVINLFGPPGVGKTLSAEATSEHLRRPLYVVGSGDLGTSAGSLDNALREAFELAAAWRAVLLIDEADVFLEQRSLHDLERNAMVAVFLRHVEYYRGILFMTTNRIRTFDEAFLSRIHVALHFDELNVPTKVQIWRAFLLKAGLGEDELEEGLLAKLAQRDINGRQIKNACRTATSLAVSQGEKMRYEHLEQALNAMEEFMADFNAIRVHIIDVSQSVEHDHPHAFDFLRSDLRNIEDFFSKHGVRTVGLRRAFEFVTRERLVHDDAGAGKDENESRVLCEWMDTPEAADGEAKASDDAVFMQSYIPRTLNEVFDPERDVDALGRGEGAKLIYKDTIGIVGPNAGKKGEDGVEDDQRGPAKAAAPALTKTGGNTPKKSVTFAGDDVEEDSEVDREEEDGGVGEGDDGSEGEDSGEEDAEGFKDKKPRGHRHEDKEEKKQRKKAVKEEAREKRKQKIPKAEKKRRIKTTARGG